MNRLCWRERHVMSIQTLPGIIGPATTDQGLMQPTEDEEEYLYRFEARRYTSSTVTEWGGEEWHTVGPLLTIRRFRIIKRTPQGAWIRELPIGERRFVLLTARKKFACSTREEALESFIARKRAHVRHAKARLHSAERELALAERLQP